MREYFYCCVISAHHQSTTPFIFYPSLALFCLLLYEKLADYMKLDYCDPIASCTGQPRYVKLSYLEYIAYVEVVIYSWAFVKLGYHEISAISKCFFIPENYFPLLYLFFLFFYIFRLFIGAPPFSVVMLVLVKVTIQTTVENGNLWNYNKYV